MHTTTPRPLRALTAAALTAVLLPAAPALAQTAPPTPTPTATPTPTTTPTPSRPQVSVSAATVDVGGTVELTVRGTAGQVVDLLASSARASSRTIRTATLDAAGTVRWTLQPGETTSFVARPRGDAPAPSEAVTVGVRRTVSIGIRQANGVYTFSGAVAPALPGVRVTIARLDPETGRVTGVASSRTGGGGRYEIPAYLPVGLAGYYALTEATPDLLAGRSRLYGLLVNVRPGAPAAAETVSIAVRRLGEYHVFTGTVTPRRSGVPVTLARVVDGRVVGFVGGRTGTTGEYSLSVPLAPGRYAFQTLTAAARSRVHDLVVPG